MSEYHCLDIECLYVDFSPYYIKGKKGVDKIHHAHLFSKNDEIEIRIFYDDSSYFEEKLATSTSSIDYKNWLVLNPKIIS